ncbi:C40 family peptidase [Deinococcus rubellus]|uniref:C40 family peptidase n=1 Tax=Deinococcus rubellus TaxID=1889240 RepID=A0ABY5YDQ2_9DEIO|nr:C40 family peptidase [Deinococcus rubellus]UWX63056.1 C40 family peptidase [Deinococcus rubellus]
MNELDPRIHAYDDTGRLAETALLGRLDQSFTFVEPTLAWTGPARLSLHARPDLTSPQVTEALPGEALEVVVRRADGWAWLRTRADGYLGFARTAGVVAHAPADPLAVTALRGHVYAQPSIKSPLVSELCLGAQVSAAGDEVTEHGRRWRPVEGGGGNGGWVQAVCFEPLPDADPAALALRFLAAPYVWGGRSAWGLDCSGLAQLVFGVFGQRLPRDADQQQAALTVVDSARRSDLAFFPGHVGIMLDGKKMVHANAGWMAVSVETLGEGEYGKRLQAELLGFGRWEA